MKIIEVVINGKALQFPANDSGWISDKEQKLPGDWTMEKLAELPRLRNGCNGCPVVKLGNKEVKIGWQAWTDKEKETYNAYRKSGGSGSGHVPSAKAQELDKRARIVLGNPEVVKALDKETVEFFKSCLLEDPKIVKAVKALMDATGIDEETARKMVAKAGK